MKKLITIFFAIIFSFQLFSEELKKTENEQLLEQFAQFQKLMQTLKYNTTMWFYNRAFHNHLGKSTYLLRDSVYPLLKNQLSIHSPLTLMSKTKLMLDNSDKFISTLNVCMKILAKDKDYENSENYIKALEPFEEAINFNEKVEQNLKQTMLLLNNLINEEKVQKELNQKLIKYGLGLAGIIIMLVLTFLAFLFKSRNKIQNQKEEITSQLQLIKTQKHFIEEQQKELKDSINYAKHIQNAILPPIPLLKEKLKECFVLYKPKDIVAGDFYWLEEINDTILIAAADCTGHGVPGAMVSVVCNNALNRAVKEFHLTDTGQILDKVTELVLESFSRSETEVKDGMDISLLSINFKNKEIKWSGANNPLWYFTKDVSSSPSTSLGLAQFENKQMKEITADKQPIGKSDNHKNFTTHRIEYKPETTFFLFTDGLADQFGGPKGKKFKYKQFQEVLLNKVNEIMIVQKEFINLSLENWKGDLEQVDDICVIGIRV